MQGDISYAIVRNEKLTRDEAKGRYIHNERKTRGHTNKDIDPERKRIMYDNKELHNEVDKIKSEYKQKEFNLKWEYKSQIKGLEKENKQLHKVVDKFKETIDKFIKWICKKFDMGAENNLIKDFERENNILLDVEKQIKHEEREKDLEMER